MLASVVTDTSLDLSSTGITRLGGDAFASFSHITALDLSDNPGLGNVSRALFLPLSSLKLLNLTRTALAELPIGVFDGVPAAARVLLPASCQPPCSAHAAVASSHGTSYCVKERGWRAMASTTPFGPLAGASVVALTDGSVLLAGGLHLTSNTLTNAGTVLLVG